MTNKMKQWFYAILAVMCLNLAYTFTYNEADAKTLSNEQLSNLLLRSNIELIGYEGGCFDLKADNKYIVRCA